MMYLIMGKKENKAFCYPVDNVKKINNGYCYRDKDGTIQFCFKNEIVENPVFTGKKCLGYQEIILE